MIFFIFETTFSPSIFPAPPPDEEDLVQARRIDELSKTFNMLLNSLEPGFLWTFLGDWYRRIVENNEFERQIHDFSQVKNFLIFFY